MNRLFGNMPANKAARVADCDSFSSVSNFSPSPPHSPSSPMAATPEEGKKNLTISLSAFLFFVLVVVFLGSTMNHYQKYAEDYLDRKMLNKLHKVNGALA